jgi:hypothetical protein
MTINLLGLAVLLQETTKDTHASHPEEFHGHSRVRCTLALSVATVTTLAASNGVFADAESTVDNDGLLDDETILDQLANVLT